MASCDPFDVNFSGSAQQLFEKLQTLIQDAHGTISGDAAGGAFTIPTPLGKVEGTFSTSGQTCEIHITKHPFLLSCKRIESFVKDHITTVDGAAVTDL